MRFGDADRSLRTDTRDGAEVRVLVVEKRYDAPRPDVWHAVTDRRADRPLARARSPATSSLGGRYQVEGNAGGTVLRCEEPERLEVTWEFGGDVTWVLAHPHRGRRRHPAPARARGRRRPGEVRPSSAPARSASAGRWPSAACAKHLARPGLRAGRARLDATRPTRRSSAPSGPGLGGRRRRGGRRPGAGPGRGRALLRGVHDPAGGGTGARLRRPRRPGPAPDPGAARRAASGPPATWSR